MTSKSFSNYRLFKLVCFFLPIFFLATIITLVHAKESIQPAELAQKDKTKPAEEEEEEEEDDC